MSEHTIEKDTVNQRRDSAGLFIPAGLFVGFALGFIFHNPPAGIFGGLGIGFLLFALVRLFTSS
jgi:uncharacterized membrane protein